MRPVKNDRNHVTPPEIERNGLFMAGGYGTGKTHLAAAIANQLISEGTACICMTMIDLLDRIRETYKAAGSDVDEAYILSQYEDVPLLIIDDIGSEQPTEWGVSKIFAIINARYEGYMPTIITTNYSGPELVQRMTPESGDSRNAEKTLDRLKETCVGIGYDVGELEGTLMNSPTLLCGDCLELMKRIPNGSIDMVLSDRPYGTTRCRWDTPINLQELWNCLRM